MYDHISALQLEHRPNGVLVATLNDPPMNGFAGKMHDDLRDVLIAVNHDPKTKVLVVTGAGDKAFSAGGDIKEMQKALSDPASTIPGFIEAGKLLYALIRLEKPMISRVNGHAMGLGATVALFADLCYAVETAKIGDPHVSVGYTAGDGGALIWPQLIGYMRAREYLLTGDPIIAKDAAEIGLINKAVPREQLDEVAYGMADRLAGGASVAINLTKQMINMPLRRHLDGMIDASAWYETISHFSKDHAEAVNAFVEKRKPNFTGE